MEWKCNQISLPVIQNKNKRVRYFSYDEEERLLNYLNPDGKEYTSHKKRLVAYRKLPVCHFVIVNRCQVHGDGQAEVVSG